MSRYVKVWPDMDKSWSGKPRNGKIILTDGLLHDFQYLDWNGENWENKAIYPSKRLVKLKNPDAIVEHLIDIEYLEAEDLELQFKSINSAQKIREKIVKLGAN